MAGRGRGGAGTKGRGRGRGADASGAARARRPEAKEDRNSGEGGQDSELVVLGEAPAQQRPPSSSASLSGGEGNAAGSSDATDAVTGRSLTQVGLESTDGPTRTGANEGNGPASDVSNDPRVDLNRDLARAGEEETDSELDEEQEINKGLEELQNLCLVLGINYEQKLTLEFGSEVDKERLHSSIVILKKTLADNFLQLQITANELLNAWKTADSSYERMSKLAMVLTVRDATRPESVTTKGYLATSLLSRANKEVRSIQDEALRKIRNKYLAKRKKLIMILSKSHLVPLDVEFDPNKTVNPDQYKAEKQHLKDCIRKAKRLVGDRKELVLRVELVQNCLKSKASLPFCPALIGDARKTVLKMREVPEAEILFDGVEIDDVINGLEETWKTMQSELEEDALKKNAQVKSRTRSGRVPPSTN